MESFKKATLSKIKIKKENTKKNTEELKALVDPVNKEIKLINNRLIDNGQSTQTIQEIVPGDFADVNTFSNATLKNKKFWNARNLSNILEHDNMFLNNKWDDVPPPSNEHTLLLLGHGSCKEKIIIPVDVRVVLTATCGMTTTQSSLEIIEKSLLGGITHPVLPVTINTEERTLVPEYYTGWGGKRILVKQYGSDLTDYSIHLLYIIQN